MGSRWKNTGFSRRCSRRWPCRDLVLCLNPAKRYPDHVSLDVRPRAESFRRRIVGAAVHLEHLPFLEPTPAPGTVCRVGLRKIGDLKALQYRNSDVLHESHLLTWFISKSEVGCENGLHDESTGFLRAAACPPPSSLPQHRSRLVCVVRHRASETLLSLRERSTSPRARFRQCQEELQAPAGNPHQPAHAFYRHRSYRLDDRRFLEEATGSRKDTPEPRHVLRRARSSSGRESGGSVPLPWLGKTPRPPAPRVEDRVPRFDSGTRHLRD